MSKRACQLRKGPFHQCCCNCVNQQPVISHHCSSESPEAKLDHQHKNCYRWDSLACAHPSIGAVFANWPRHSVGCECYTALSKADRAARDKEWRKMKRKP